MVTFYATADILPLVGIEYSGCQGRGLQTLGLWIPERNHRKKYLREGNKRFVREIQHTNDNKRIRTHFLVDMNHMITIF